MLTIKCPKFNKDLSIRKKELIHNLDEWITSDSLLRLIELFGGDINSFRQMDIKTYRKNAILFSKMWDYRKKNNAVERMFLNNDDFIEKNKDEILKCVEELGFIGKYNVDDKKEATYILPLGGARFTNLYRPLMAKKVLDENGWQSKVIALTGIRPLQEIEMESVRTYSDGNNEYEAMCDGMRQAFDLKLYNKVIIQHENIFLQEHNCFSLDGQVGVVAAPSQDPGRRANSVDTYRYFLDKYPHKEGDKVVLVTSAIYVPVQMAQFIKFALENEIEADIVGVDEIISGERYSKAVNYLQEVKATLDCMERLYEEYDEES